MADIPCPHCGEVLKVNPDALGSQLVCPKCHVILRLAKDDEKPPSLLERLRRRRVAVGLAGLLVVAAFAAGFSLGNVRSSTTCNNRGVVQTAFGLFFAHNEVHINDNQSKTVTADGDEK